MCMGWPRHPKWLWGAFVTMVGQWPGVGDTLAFAAGPWPVDAPGSVAAESGGGQGEGKAARPHFLY